MLTTIADDCIRTFYAGLGAEVPKNMNSLTFQMLCADSFVARHKEQSLNLVRLVLKHRDKLNLKRKLRDFHALVKLPWIIDAAKRHEAYEADDGSIKERSAYDTEEAWLAAARARLEIK